MGNENSRLKKIRQMVQDFIGRDKRRNIQRSWDHSIVWLQFGAGSLEAPPIDMEKVHS